MMSACPICPLWANSLRVRMRLRTSVSSCRTNCASVRAMNSCDRRMSSTRSSPRKCWLSAKSIESFFCPKVSVRSALMIFARMLYVLSSVMRPEGISMLTTWHCDWLMYFTNEAKPPDSGLFSPEPKSPSTTSVSAVRRGGSKSRVTSMKSFTRRPSPKRFLLMLHSSESLLWILNR